MKDITYTANVYHTGTISKRLKYLRQLTGSVFVRALGNTDEKVAARVANVAAIDRPWFGDDLYKRTMMAQFTPDIVDFAATAWRARARDHRATFGDDRGVFDKRRVRISLIGW